MLFECSLICVAKPFKNDVFASTEHNFILYAVYMSNTEKKNQCCYTTQLPTTCWKLYDFYNISRKVHFHSVGYERYIFHRSEWKAKYIHSIYVQMPWIMSAIEMQHFIFLNVRTIVRQIFELRWQFVPHKLIDISCVCWTHWYFIARTPHSWILIESNVEWLSGLVHTHTTNLVFDLQMDKKFKATKEQHSIFPWISIFS